MSITRFIIRCLLGALLCSCLLGAPAYASGGGGGGHGGGDKAKAEAKDDQKAKKKEAVSITGGQTADDPVYLHLAPITLPIINDYGAQQIVNMLVDLNTKDKQTAEDMQKQMPKLKDAMLQALYGSLSDGSIRNAQALDIVKIKANIMETLNRVYEPGAVKDVLVQAVAQRRL